MIKFELRATAPLKTRSDCLIIGVTEGHLRSEMLQQIDQTSHGALKKAGRSGEFSGKAGQSLLLHGAPDWKPERLLLVGLGPLREQNQQALRQAAAGAMEQLRKRRLTKASLDLAGFIPPRSSAGDAVSALCEGLQLANYRFDRYRGPDAEQPPELAQVTLLQAEKQGHQELQQTADAATALCQAVYLARDLVNEPGNTKSPAYLAEQATEIASDRAIGVKVLQQAELEEEGCGALLGVAQGSCRDPRLIIMEYQGAATDQAPIVLVGKGVVFDAGGISLKPAEKMDEMKMDMAGGAAVIATLQAVADLELPINLVGIIPAVENLPSGTAYRPGDILTSLSGKTIEVLNTDAEGRLILADALTYAKRFNPKLVIDLATLTGACIIALGNHAAAVLGQERLAKRLIAAGERSGERLWQLPLWDDYAKQLKSPVADLKNIGGRSAGTITAAAFLQSFANDFTWAHIDIAGTAWESEGRHYLPKGGTGFGVRLLVEFLREQG